MDISAARRVVSQHFRAEIRISKNEIRGHDAILQDFLIVIHVPKEEIERLDTLFHTPVKLPPVFARDDTGNHVERQDAIDRRTVAVNRESNAESKKLTLGVLGALAKMPKLKLLQPVPECCELTVAILRGAEKLAIKMPWGVGVERCYRCGILQCCNCRHANPSSAFSRSPVELKKHYDQSSQSLAPKFMSRNINLGTNNAQAAPCCAQCLCKASRKRNLQNVTALARKVLIRRGAGAVRSREAAAAEMG